ncbi:MAG: aspartate aminotransferase family protein [Thermoanaerobaculia bacterium]
MVLARGDLLPEIRTPLPGPQSMALARALARYEAPGINTLGGDDEPAIVWHAACGANVLDVDGNRFVDFTSGFGAATIGHRHPRVIAAIARQATELLHGLGDVAAHPARIALARKLCELAPIDEPRVHFAVSGADAVEIAWKSAILATGRRRLLTFDPGYHGLSLGALAATSRPEFRVPFAAQLSPHVARLPFACPLERVAEQLAGRGGAGAADSSSCEFAAVLVEPIVGREGVLVPPAGWLAGLARLCREAGALLILDEILTGFARTGRMFACEHEAVRPDLLCCGKALGGGLPLAAVVGRSAVMAAWRTGGEALHTGTFVAHPLACAAALATLEILADERLAERAARLGESLAAALAPVTPPRVALRGRGALWGLELPTQAAAATLVDRLRRRGLLLLRGGPSGRVVELLPPLVLSADQLAFALAAIGEELAAAAA